VEGRVVVGLVAGRIVISKSRGGVCVGPAAITACLARGAEPLDAVREAKDFISRAIAHSLEIGHGHGPVNPMFGHALGLRGGG